MQCEKSVRELVPALARGSHIRFRACLSARVPRTGSNPPFQHAVSWLDSASHRVSPFSRHAQLTHFGGETLDRFRLRVPGAH